jgi:hypothetical protein
MKIPHPHLSRKRAVMMVIATYSVVAMAVTAYDWLLPHLTNWING